MTKEELKALLDEATAGMQKRLDLMDEEVKDLRATEPTTKVPPVGDADVVRTFGNEFKVCSNPAELGLRAAMMMALRHQSRNDDRRALEMAHRAGLGDVAAGFEKALATSPLADGGAGIPEQFSSELIELLRNGTMFRSMGPVIVPMPRGSLTIGKQTGASTLSYLGESENYAVSQPSFGNITLQAKKAGGIVAITEELLNDSPLIGAQVIRDDLVAGLRILDDSTMIRSAGGENSPTGVRYQLDAANVLTAAMAGAASTSAEIEDDLMRMLRRLLESNIPMTRPGWMMANRSFLHLAALRDSNGNKIFPELMTTKMLHGMPVSTGNQIPINLGGGSDESEVYLGDFAQVYIGETGGIELSTEPGAAYFDGSTVQSAFSRDEVPIKVRFRNDMRLRHTASFVVLQTVLWGS